MELKGMWGDSNFAVEKSDKHHLILVTRITSTPMSCYSRFLQYNVMRVTTYLICLQHTNSLSHKTVMPIRQITIRVNIKISD